ncbi:MAG: glycosyltransferase family 2 protein [Dokdonella sp.]
MSAPPGAWLATGGDPQFACRTSAYPLRGGWYRLSLDFESLDDKISPPRLYFDFGQGLSEARSLTLNFVHPAAARHEGIVLLAQNVAGLRFDPAITRCEFRTRRMRLRRVSRARAAVAMVSDVWSRRTRWSARLGWLCGGLGKLLRQHGPSAFATWLYAAYMDRGVEQRSYDRWLTLFDQPQAASQAHAASAVSPAAVIGKRGAPLFSILLPTYNTPERWLRRCLDSVLQQTYPHWELCVADDASSRPQVRKVLEEYAARDPRIRVTLRSARGHISEASNSALELARGDYAALLDHDDELHPEALHSFAEAIAEHPRWKLIYSDEDKIDTQGRRFDPYFKPDWNIELLRGHNCFSHLGVYALDLLHAVGGFRKGLEGSQDWDLVLRCAERLDETQIGHVPRVLYHWRVLPGSTSMGVEQKNYAHVSGRRAIREHLERSGVTAEVLDIESMAGAFRVRYALPSPPPLVSIIIPTRDRLDLLRQCVDSILDRTTYPRYEIVIVDNQSAEQATLDYFAGLADQPLVKIVHHDGPFNYSRINNHAVSECSGSMVCLLNNDIEVITPEWLDELVGHAAQPEIGAVGAMLYYPNDTIQHAGVVTGIQGVASHAYCGMQRGYPGYMGRALLVQSMSAVTAACLLVRRAVFEQVGGLDESLAVAFNDIDFCLRIGRAGYRNLWTPFAELYHHESASRGDENTPEKQERFHSEIELMQKRWAGVLENDPSYNPNLAIYGEPYTLAFPPREAFGQSARKRVGARVRKAPDQRPPARDHADDLTADLVLDHSE